MAAREDRSGDDRAPARARRRASTRSTPDYFKTLLEGTIAAAPELEQAIAPHLDREFARLSPVERGILLLAGYELTHQPDVPYRAVINEAVELAKSYGGTDGYKYVNGVLDKLAAQLRSAEQEIVNGNSEMGPGHGVRRCLPFTDSRFTIHGV